MTAFISKCLGVAPYARDIGRPVEALRTEIAASSPGWTEADIEGKIDELHKVSREAVVSVFSEAGQMGELLARQHHRSDAADSG